MPIGAFNYTSFVMEVIGPGDLTTGAPTIVLITYTGTGQIRRPQPRGRRREGCRPNTPA
jgi:hypothetical protein